MPFSDDEILVFLKEESTLEKGFRLLMEKYQERIYWHIRRILENHDDTNDVIQNTFIKAFRGLKIFEERSSLYTWLYKIATNEALTFKKNKKAKATSSVDDEAYKLAEKSTSDFDESVAYDKLSNAINELPDRQKQVFNMRYYDELSYQEMASILELSEGALKASYHHAVKKIESFLLA
jgi:RNA polymerase sigma factor (sigma-70 family)